jgi:TRAP transporter TAXI family solute receptor
MDAPKSAKRPAIVAALIETFGFSPAVATVVVFLVAALLGLAALWVIRSAPPRTVVLTSGPEGSSFQRTADNYQKALAKRGVALEIRPSGGSLDNLKRLQAGEVDIGFVTGGISEGQDLARLMSLGSVAYQPLLVFYRSPGPIERLSELAGRQIAVGAPGSAARVLALTLLKANGIEGVPTTFLDLDAGAAATALLEGKVDAIFLTGDSASTQTLRSLMRSQDVRLYNFDQADAYVRRYAFLNKIELPEGSIDLGRNLPASNVTLVGPTVELVARKELNSVLSDLLLEAAREVHGRPGLLQKRGEFPAPLEHEFTLSEEAQRYYKSGMGFTYRIIPSFWLANLVNRTLVAVVPLAIILIPVLRVLPIGYRMRIRLRLFKCYRPLLKLERDSYGSLTPERVAELQTRLDEIEHAVDALRVPASFADQFYELRTHVAFVRQRLNAAEARLEKGERM